MVEQRYQELWERLHQLRESWQELRLILREDRPAGDGALLVDWLDDRVDDGLGDVDEALAAVVGALQSPDDVRNGSRALSSAHEHAGRLARGYWNELGSPERQAQLRSLAHRRGGEWGAWGSGVHDALGRIPPRLEQTDDALRQAWADLVERAIGERAVTTHIAEGRGT